MTMKIGDDEDPEQISEVEDRWGREKKNEKERGRKKRVGEREREKERKRKYFFNG